MQRAKRAAAEEAREGRSSAEAQRAERLARAESVLRNKLQTKLALRREAEKRAAAREHAAAHERELRAAQAAVAAEQAAARASAASRRQDYLAARVASKLSHDGARTDALLKSRAEAISRVRRERERPASAGDKPRLPGPQDIDNRFFAIGCRSSVTAGRRPKLNGPAFSMGTRSALVSAPLPAGPGPGRYRPNTASAGSTYAVSMAPRYPMLQPANGADTPSPADVRGRWARGARPRAMN